MVVDEISDVSVTASLGTTGGPEPGGNGPLTTVQAATLHCEVRATLRGQGFVIDPSDAQAGSFLDSPDVSWRWQVTPTSAGSRTLHFELLPLARDGDLQLPGTPVLFAATIAVDAQPQSFWDHVDDVVSGVVEYPLVTSFGALVAIAGVLAAGWTWVLKRPWPWATPRRPALRRPPPPRQRRRRR